MQFDVNKYQKIFKDNKIARVRLWQIYKCAYLHQIALEIMSLLVSLVNDLHMKNSPQKYVKKDEIFGSARTNKNLYEKCNRF